MNITSFLLKVLHRTFWLFSWWLTRLYLAAKVLGYLFLTTRPFHLFNVVVATTVAFVSAFLWQGTQLGIE